MPFHFANPRLDLEEMVTPHGPTLERDSINTKRALQYLGLYDPSEFGIDGMADSDMFNAIERFQKENSLRPDRVIRPTGPTARAINAALRHRATGSDGRAGGGTLLSTHPRLDLEETVTPKEPVSEQDAIATKHALKSLGYYDPPPWGIDGRADDWMFQGIEEFQKDMAIKRDRVIRADGPTRQLINEHLRRKAPADHVLASGTQLSQAPSPPGGGGGTKSREDLLFQRYRKNLRKREGGYVNDPVDRGGPTRKGISQEFLNLLRKKKRWPHLPAQTKHLTDPQTDDIYRVEIFDLGQIAKLEQIPRLEALAPELPEQIFDSGVLHDILDAGRWLQQSLDEVLGTDLTKELDDGSRVYDGIVGSKTRRAVAKAIQAGRIVEVNDLMVDKRQDFMRKLARTDPSQQKYLAGWLARAESFRIVKP
jgi:lysozyme family protein